MDALLILGGLLLILVGLVWLVMRAFDTSLLWGCGSLLPPLTLLYTLVHWRRARQAVVLIGLGFVPLVVGLTLMASQDTKRLEAIFSLKWLEPEVQAPAELAIELRGELNGQAFSPQQGELIDGFLSLREGQDFFARRELSILLPNPAEGAVRLDILPDDTGTLPEVEVSWLLPDQDLPEARRLSRGYTLHLDLQPVPPNKLAGAFHLVLPPSFKTTLSGKVELFTDGLRYRDGKVDQRVDSLDTLGYVIQDYLQRRFATPAVSLAPLPPVTFPATNLELTVEAQIAGQTQQLPILLKKDETRGWTVEADRFAPLPAVSAIPAPAEATAAEPDVAVAERISRPVDRRVRFSMEGLLRSPSRYQNIVMRALTVRGSTAEGRFQGIDQEGRIVLRQRMSGGPGEASYTLSPDEVERIELLEP